MHSVFKKVNKIVCFYWLKQFPHFFKILCIKSVLRNYFCDGMAYNMEVNIVHGMEWE